MTNVIDLPPKRATIINGWWAIRDRLPNHNQHVLVTGKSRALMIAICDLSGNGDKIFDYVFMDQERRRQIKGVTHWMPLPEGMP